MDEYHNPNGTLHESQIILLTISGINQEASIKLTFNDLNRFLKNPFINGNTYGYPIYCEAFFVKKIKSSQEKIIIKMYLIENKEVALFVQLSW